MPHTAKFSRRFYEKLGDQVVNELVDWLNTVDLTYKSELRELNEISLQRVDATIRSEINSLRGELKKDIATLRGEVKEDIATLRGEFKGDVATLRGDMDSGLANLRADLKGDIAGLRSEMTSMRADMIKWMFVFWATSALIMLGLS